MKVILALVLAAFLITACGGADTNDQLPPAPGEKKVDAPKEAPAKDSIFALFASGTGVECTYTVPEAGEEVVQFLGKNAHVTSGMREIIVTENAMYAKNDEGDCAWIKMETEEAAVPTLDEEWSYEDMERSYNIMYENAKCSKKSFSSSTFEPSGKVCTFEDMMMAQMGDFS